MDAKQIDAVLAEVGKVFRLCRFYPATHPTVQQAMADLSAALPALAAQGDVELRIAPTGLTLEAGPVAARNPQIQELAGLLYAQGYRVVVLLPGATAEEFAALARAAASAAAKSGSTLGAVAQQPQLPHIRLEQAPSRKSGATRAVRTSAPAMHAVDDGHALSTTRGTGTFRPNAMPTPIEAGRLMALLEYALPEGARGPLARLADVTPQLVEQREFAVLAEVVRVLARWQGSEDAVASELARQALGTRVTDGAVAGMLGVAADPRGTEEQRHAATEALGLLGARVQPTVSPMLRSADPAMRLAAVRVLARVGTPEALAALAPLRQDPDPGVRAAAGGRPA